MLFCGISIFPTFDVVAKGSHSNNYLLDSDCYGFIIPLPSHDEISEIPSTQYSVMNLINDLLRINSSVYWLSSELSLFSKKIDDTTSESRIFNPGTFIVPFSGDNLLDLKIIVTVFDYNVSHELHIFNSSLEILMLLQPLDIDDACKLNEPDIALYFGEGVTTRTLDWYVSSLYKGGFLNNIFFDDYEIIEKLDNTNFNVFIWSGGSVIDDLRSDINIITRMQKQKKIKQFVENGGGFVGSCYGAIAASSGIRLFPFTFLKYFFPKIPSPYFLSIQDCLVAQALPSTINITITEQDHPVVYGLDETIYGSSLRGGPVYTNLGKNTKSLATVKEIDSSWFTWLPLSNFSILKRIIEHFMDFTTGKTIWTTSEFKNGKVVTFGDHPETGHMNLKRVIHNSVLYVTSKTSGTLYSDISYAIMYVETNGENSIGINLPEESSHIFSDILNKINLTIDSINEFIDRCDYIYFLIDELIDQNKMSVVFTYQMRAGGLWQFNESMWAAKEYLDNPSNEEDSKNYLESLEIIYDLLLSRNVSILNQINQLRDDLEERLDEINLTFTRLSDDFSDLEYELEHYQNTTNQDNIILEICKNIKSTRTIEKYSPGLSCETLKLMRDSWYTYEALVVT